jgi:pimeloyl-ACP methyl ester carboxylesterase
MTVVLTAGWLGASAQPAAAWPRPARPVALLDWRSCGVGLDCATAAVPRDYARPRGPQFEIALVRRPALDPQQRLGSVFVNPGGPGASGTAFVRDLTLRRGADARAFSGLNRRFDVVGFDPRGVGDSRPAVACLTDAEAQAQFDAPLPRGNVAVQSLLSWAGSWVERCRQRNGQMLQYLSTANVARDLDRLRAGVGDPQLTYLGYSYGTLLGATYAALFPRRVRALVLDGPVDLDLWLNRPLEATREEVAGFEHALTRFFAACTTAAWCLWTHGDPERDFDDLVARLDRQPIPASAFTRGLPVDGDTLLAAAAYAMYDKKLWLSLASALTALEFGAGGVAQVLADSYWGFDDQGGYDHRWDRYLAISALDQRAPRDLEPYLQAGRDSAAAFPHFGWSSGYFDLPWGLYRVRPRGVFRGPFSYSRNRPPLLVVGTTDDPATPYAWARSMTRQLGNARLLTMTGDGHTAFGGNSACIDEYVVRYLEEQDLPAPGTTCQQRLWWESSPAPAQSVQRAGAVG